LADHFAQFSLTGDGAVHHWLTTGLITTPLIDALAASVDAHGSPFASGGRWIINYWGWHPDSPRLKQRVYAHVPPLEWTPGARPSLNGEGPHGRRWTFAECEEDHVVDLSTFNFSPQRMQGWAFTLLNAEKAQTVEAEIIAIGPARLWVNGDLITHYRRRFSYVVDQHVPARFKLKPGLNEIYVHAENMGWREARLTLGLRLRRSTGVDVRLPLGSVTEEQWREAYNALSNVLVRQYAFPKLPALFSVSDALEGTANLSAAVSVPVPENYAEAAREDEFPTGRAEYHLTAGQRAELPVTADVADSVAGMPWEVSLSLRFRPANSVPIQHTREIFASASPYSDRPYGDYDSRRREAVEHLAGMPMDVMGSLAAVELGKAAAISSRAIDVACEYLNSRYDCADFYAISLLAALYRHRNTPALAEADQHRIEVALRGFKFWITEPGLDAMCYFTENHQILFHTTGYLTGQLYEDWTFSNSGLTGREQKRLNRDRLVNWIQRRLMGSFSEWDSNAYLTMDAYAMLALIEFSKEKRIRDLATTMLNKIFFLIACQSYRGGHASTHGRCYVTALKSSRVENTSNLERIAWGMGLFNGETRATGMLALARNYRVPDVIQAIGADMPPLLVTQARAHADFRPHYDCRGGSWDVRTLTRRTPDGLMAAALDHRPGAMGIQEHLWQVTLSPEAVVFTSYPGNSQEHGHARPNFWAGSARLPRVGMHNRSLMCLYRLEPGAGLGFSHAYFPVDAFEESVIEGNWAFGRFGDGYVGLWGDGDLRLTQTGRHAGQELRSAGESAAWIATIGSKAEDSDFRQFIERAKRFQPTAESGAVCATIDGEDVRFGWEGPMRANGQAVSSEHYPHYDNLYTHTPWGAETMTLAHGGKSLTLELRRVQRQD
jgi:hypothetical protein